MKTAIVAKFMLAGTVVLSLGTAAFAQQALTGIVTQVNRINGTVAIRQTQAGTVGTVSRRRGRVQSARRAAG